MQGPDTLGDEFDEATEEAKADPDVLYADIEDSEIDRTITIRAATGDRIAIQVDGDDVRITVQAGGEKLSLTVARTPLEEDLRKIGLVRTDEPGALA